MGSALKIWEWLKARWAERTTWDGAVLIGVSVLALMASPIVKYVAFIGIAYGAYRVWEQESAS
jgi:hypothetical protein|tara:strand:- start:120 stop:308 length:189 start_codon:yes stop_codon:yes gene_type:complete